MYVLSMKIKPTILKAYKIQRITIINGYFTTISGRIFANCIFIFQKSTHLRFLCFCILCHIYCTHRRRKYGGSSPNSLRPISYFGNIWELYVLDPKTNVFCREKIQLHFHMNKGLTVPK